MRVLERDVGGVAGVAGRFGQIAGLVAVRSP